MSLFDRRSFLLMPLALTLAACGFTPVYAPGQTGSSLYGAVEFRAPKDETSYRFGRNMEERLGRTSSGTYRLDYELKLDEEGQAITPTGEITRFSIEGVVAYKLIRLSDEAVVTKGSSKNFTGYSAEGSTVDVLVGEQDAVERLMVILADQVTADLLASDLAKTVATNEDDDA